MKSVSRTLLATLLSAVVLTGCATFEATGPEGDFVRSTNFSPLDTFSYKHTMVSGMAFRGSQELAFKKLSPQVLTEELTMRGFEAVESGGDFYVVTKWRKELSSHAGIFDSVDGPTATMNRNSYTASAGAVRFTLVVELYETATSELFWSAELPNIFDAIQYSEERVSLSLRRAIQNFPDRIEKDPNLPNIE